MKQPLLACVVCMILLNLAWGEGQTPWKAKCEQDSMTDDRSCHLSTSTKSMILVMVIPDTIAGHITAMPMRNVLDSDSTHYLRIDRNKAWNSQRSDNDSASFYSGATGSATWNEHIQEFKNGEVVRVRLNLWPEGTLEETFSLKGFAEAYQQLRQRAKQYMGVDIENP